MQKLVAIFSALLILFSGLPFTLSTHFCGGEIAAVKMSFSGDDASCGMPEKKPAGQKGAIDTDCCHNHDLTYTVEENYTPSAGTNMPENAASIAPSFTAPVNVMALPVDFSNSYHQAVFPRNSRIAGSVPLSGLCNLRL